MITAKLRWRTESNFGLIMKISMIRTFFNCFLALSVTFLVSSFSQAETEQSEFTEAQTLEARLKALEVLINRRQFEQAYRLADRLLETQEGDPEFDFRYGMAAIETGNYDQALFAFERLLFINPNNPRYRLELARAHFYLRNLRRSETEFKQVLAQNPPAPVKKNVDKFLDMIAEFYRQVEPELLISIDMGGGYDSNINSATSEDELPAEELIFPVDITLNEDSKETGSTYWSSLLQFAYLSPISKTQSWDVRAIYNKRANSETTLYDLDTLIAEGAYGFFTGPLRWRLAGRYQSIKLDGEDFLNSVSFLGNTRWRMDSGASYGLGINLGQSEYEDNPDGDLEQMQYRLSYQSSPSQKNWNLSVIFGSDSAKESSNEFNGKSYQGVSVQQQVLLGQRSSYYWLASLTASEYDAINSALYTKLRKDTTFNAGIGWRYNITSRFSFRNDYSASYQDSSLEANTYKRFKAELGLSYRI